MSPSIAVQNTLKQKLSASTLVFQAIAGGSINQTYQLTAGDIDFFCKINSATKFPQLFLKESHGLEAIRKTKAIKVPAVIDCFQIADEQVLLIEWIRKGERSEQFWKNFGTSLAALHNISNKEYGYGENNYMGSIQQYNDWNSNWNTFFIEQRLKPLVAKCFIKSFLTTRHQTAFEKLYTQLPRFFEDQKPALLHGDLWSGNFMCNDRSEPVLIDPAIYYGHRSVDLAMTTLFGGFHSLFYEAYQSYYSFPANYSKQWKICNLYPLLIHLLLFDKSYLLQIEQTLNEFA
ncbi:MAG: fructosamine kinase family protein [Bacteroidota bacterium]|nr:fructosamine kinase family protein [Bacteroidota bacterium]